MPNQGVDAGWRQRTSTASVLGVTQILAFGSTYYLLAVLAAPIAADTGWPLAWVVGGVSLGLFSAGLVSPKAGAMIQQHGGRPVLALSSLVIATGLTAMALAPSLPVYIAAWLIVGTGMGAGLYDAAFGTLGRLYGREARSAITTLTLWGGFASTVCWPLTAWLSETLGWRGACGVYAGLHVLVCFPLHAFLIPAAKNIPEDAPVAPLEDGIAPEVSPIKARDHVVALITLAAMLTIGSVIAAVISVHLLGLLQLRGMDLGAAVALGALFGPSQVAARLVEATFARHYHPIWTMSAGVVLVVSGLSALASGLPVTALALVLFGAGNGIFSIARGTVPLALFGPRQYARLMGRLATPGLFAQALAPTLSAILLSFAGGSSLLWTLALLAAVNVGLVGALWVSSRAARSDVV